MNIDLSKVPNPCFLLVEDLLKSNLRLLNKVREEAGVEIILALKGYALWKTFPLVGDHLDGATASSLHEAMLINDEMGCKAHTYAPAYTTGEFSQIEKLSSHLTFNSFAQFEKFAGKLNGASPGIRINPGFSNVSVAMYNPCSPGSRLGVTIDEMPAELPSQIEGLHFHALCESDSFSLENTIREMEKHFGHYLKNIKWLNMGGGHLITKKDYDVNHLITTLRQFRERHPHLKVILEPGAAIGWETGYLVSKVLDIVENKGIKTAILNVSFSAHMPDTLEMPYKPKVFGATDPVEGKPTYRLGGMTCLAGDFKGDYSFEEPLKEGDLIVFNDMIHYTMVKTTHFNGVPHPSIGIWKEDNSFELYREFGYEDYKNRLS